MKAIFLSIVVILLLQLGEGIFIGGIVPAISLVTSSILAFAAPSLAKQELIKGLMEIDKQVMINPTKEVNMTDVAAHTYDAKLLGIYYNAFLGKFNTPEPFDDKTHLVELINDFDLENLVSVNNKLAELKERKFMNLDTLRYFLYTQSILIKEVDNPYDGEAPTLEQLNFDFQFNQDLEILHFEKLNYLALMEFWKEYV